jgi:hypothetical protein
MILMPTENARGGQSQNAIALPDGARLLPTAKSVPPAPLVDVMFEQLEYLAAHLSDSCPTDCPDCRRLMRAAAPLLEPFR